MTSGRGQMAPRLMPFPTSDLYFTTLSHLLMPSRAANNQRLKDFLPFVVFKGRGEYQLRTLCRFRPWAGKRRKVAASCPANAWLGLLSCRDGASVRKDEEGGDVGRKPENESENSQLGRFAADPLLLQAPGRRGVWLRAGSGLGGWKMRTGQLVREQVSVPPW